jgi:hypothetical protein
MGDGDDIGIIEPMAEGVATGGVACAAGPRAGVDAAAAIADAASARPRRVTNDPCFMTAAYRDFHRFKSGSRASVRGWRFASAGA